MLETLMFKQGKKALGLNAIAFKTSSATATTIATSDLGSGFTTEYSIDGGDFTPTGTSFVIPTGDHEVTLSLTVESGTILTLTPFKDILTEVTDWESFQLPRIRFNNCAKLTKVPDQLPVALTDMSYMFQGCTSFNQDINGWDTSRVTNMRYMFNGCTSFKQDIGNWDTSNVTNMSYMFHGCTNFNRNISRWDTGNVTTMDRMFYYCTNFNQDIGNWDVSNVTDMTYMFYSCAAFNQDIGNWDVSKVTVMKNMFRSCVTFNQDIGNWDTSNVTDIYGMFYGCTAFNQNISGWNVSQVTDMRFMFYNCSAFKQDLSSMVFKSTVTRNSYDSGATSWSVAYRPKFTG